MFRFLPCLLLALAVGCASDATPVGNPVPKSDPAAQSAGSKLLLDREPGPARGVIAIRKDAKDGEEVVVVGQVGGNSTPLSDGRAIFLIADSSMKPTATCDCPWDFCEYPKDDVAAARMTVKFVDADGKPIRHGAHDMFGIKELSTVVIKGKISRDENNVTLVASGIYVRPEKR